MTPEATTRRSRFLQAARTLRRREDWTVFAEGLRNRVRTVADVTAALEYRA